MDAIRGVISRAQAEFVAKKMDIRKHYPHVNVDSLVFNADKKRYEADCTCTKCGQTHRRTAQDFYQCELCPICKDKERKTLAAERRKQLALFLKTHTITPVENITTE